MLIFQPSLLPLPTHHIYPDLFFFVFFSNTVFSCFYFCLCLTTLFLLMKLLFLLFVNPWFPFRMNENLLIFAKSLLCCCFKFFNLQNHHIHVYIHASHIHIHIVSLHLLFFVIVFMLFGACCLFF